MRNNLGIVGHIFILFLLLKIHGCRDCSCNTTLICVWFCIVTSVTPHMEINTNTYNISTFYLRFI